MLKHLNSRQISDWMIYFELEPFDEQRADLRAAMLASLTANMNRKSGTPPFSELDFMPYVPNKEQIKSKQSSKQLKNFLGQRVNKKGKP